MSQTIDQNDAAADALQLLYEPIREEMEQVEQILRTELRSDHAYVDELVRYGCLLGGKRLRPALLLLTAKAVGEIRPAHLTLAAVVEMIHTATLIHDDVLDEADQRRHLATVNARWNNESSVLLGDYLFTHSFYLASTVGSTRACQIIGRATNIVCEGELRQIGSRRNFGLEENEYLEIIEAKTAELCACCCHLAGVYAESSPALVKHMIEYGRCLGIAFQIADDVLDLEGEEKTTGKSLGTDLEKQKPTLPLIRALQVAEGGDHAELLDLLNGDEPVDGATLKPWLDRYDAVQFAIDKATWYAERARRQLADVADSPARQILASLPEFVVMRSR